MADAARLFRHDILRWRHLLLHRGGQAEVAVASVFAIGLLTITGSTISMVDGGVADGDDYDYRVAAAQ